MNMLRAADVAIDGLLLGMMELDPIVPRKRYPSGATSNTAFVLPDETPAPIASRTMLLVPCESLDLSGSITSQAHGANGCFGFRRATPPETGGANGGCASRIRSIAPAP